MQDGTKGAGPGVLIATALAGLAAGAALVSLAQGSAPAEPDSATTAASAPDVTREIQALTAELAGLRRAMERAPDSGAAVDGSAPQPVRAEPSNAGAMQALADALQQLSSRLASPAAGGLPASPLPSTPEQRESVAKLFDQDRDTRRRNHLLWSMERVLQTYGAPDSIEGTETERWVWWFGSKDNPRTMSISFRDGHVVSVN